MSGITLGYMGVHGIYQLALAAHETGHLDQFYCSVVDAPGKWGGLLSRVFGSDAMVNRRCDAIPVRKVVEYPWPLLWLRARAKLRRGQEKHWVAASDRFDRRVAAGLAQSASRLFVGAETCAMHSLRAARTRGMHTMLDCEQVHPVFLWDLLARSADDLELPPPPAIDLPEMAARKQEEFETADTLLVLSEIERRSFLDHGFSEEKLVEIPLWADPSLWYQPPLPKSATNGPLRVVAIGSIDLRKGIPYLLQAAERCGDKIQLSLVGVRNVQMEPFLRRYAGAFQYISPMTKFQLRGMLWQSDVLVLPSLVDAFGLVAMEAMACGVPVIVSENCGVPVPDPAWRVPVMDAEAIAARLLCYAANRDLVLEHGQAAARHAVAYSPAAYRRKVEKLYTRVLNGSAVVG